MTALQTLKLIAEALGYNILHDQVFNDEIVILLEPEERHLPDRFTPETNPAQLVEVIKWLLKEGWKFQYLEGHGFRLRHTDKPYTTVASFEQAVMQAAAQQVRV